MFSEGSAQTLQVLQNAFRGIGARFARFFEGDYQLLSAGFTFHTSKAQHTDKKAAPIQNQLIAVKS